MRRNSCDQDDFQEKKEEAQEEEQSEVVKVDGILKFQGVALFFQGLNALVVLISIVSWFIRSFIGKKFSFTYMIDKAVGNILVSGLVAWTLEYFVMKFTGKHIVIDYSIFKKLFVAMICYYFFKALNEYNYVFGMVSLVITVGLSALYHIERHNDFGALLQDWVVVIGPESK